MLSLILLLIFGSIIAVVSMQNTMRVTVTFFNYSLSGLPLFYVIIGSLLLGILAAYCLYSVHSIASALTIRGKDQKIKQEQRELTELAKQVHQLELENARLKKAQNPANVDDRAL